MTKLMFLKNESVVDYFYQNINNEKAKKTKNYIETESEIIYPFFEKSELEINNLSTIYKQISSPKNIVILCGTARSDCLALAKRINNKKITIYDSEKTYQTFLKNSIMPPTEIEFSNSKKLAIKELLHYAIGKNRAKNYSIMGILLVVSSFFVKFKIYYLVVGSILLLLALLTLLLPYFRKQKRW